MAQWWRMCLQCWRPKFDPWLGKIPWRRKWQPTPVFLLWRVPWTEEPGGLQSVELQWVGHDRACMQTSLYSVPISNFRFIKKLENLGREYLYTLNPASPNVNDLHTHGTNEPVCMYACMCVWITSSPFICWWTLRLLPCLGYCKQCCSEHGGAWIFSN